MYNIMRTRVLPWFTLSCANAQCKASQSFSESLRDFPLHKARRAFRSFSKSLRAFRRLSLSELFGVSELLVVRHLLFKDSRLCEDNCVARIGARAH